MIFNILKNDLKRKKTMNIILFLFIVLATMFMASGINNVITVMNGTDYYLDKAGVGDYVVITMNKNDSEKSLDDVLKKESSVKEYRKEQIVFGSQKDITKKDGSKTECKNTTIYQSVEGSAITFFDKGNQPIKSIEPGHIYVAGSFVEDNELKPGDVICFEHSGVELEFIVYGIAKDALLGSDFMGNTRFIMSQEDMDKILANEVIRDSYAGQICYIDTNDVKAIKASLTDVPNIMFDGARSLITTAYVMDMIIAFIVLILSVCLIIVSFVVLRFSISFTLTEEFREIGVMKAVGISNSKVRSLYIIKYLFLSIVGALIGFFASIPFGRLLLDSVNKKMMLGNDNAILMNVLGAVIVVCVIVFFAYMCTGKVKKATPVDAIRSGQTGERYKKKTILRIHKCPTGNAFFMALNDVLSSPKRFITIIASFGICTLFVLLLVNTTTTLKSPNLLSTLVTESDLYLEDIEDGLNLMGGTKQTMLDNLNTRADRLTAAGMPAKMSIEIQYKYPMTFNGNDYTFSCQQGLNTDYDKYVYLEGVAPENKYEIAITPQISEVTGAKIGDVITIHYGDEDIDCMVTAYYQTMNQLGEVIRLHKDAPTEFEYISSTLAYQVDFTDNPSNREIELRKEKVKELMKCEKALNATEYCIECTVVADTMESVQFLLLGITLVVVVLVTILMERSFIANEKSQIAILKAIGFKDSVIIKWHVYRFGLVGILAVVLAAALSIPMTKLCITPIFGIMGAVDVKFNIEPLQIFALYPGIILAVTVLITWITALYTKNIKSSDTANIE